MKTAAIVPCYNEAITIGKVVRDLTAVIPGVQVFVFDNNSTDGTAEAASAAGAIVIREKRQGKGFVVQAMFRKVDADIYIMVDGDDTYDLSKVGEMIALVEADDADMVVGNRLKNFASGSFRPLHSFGNHLVVTLINRFFNARLTDVMSGLRVMSRNFVKNINITAAGFEVETEMSIKALKYSYIIRETDIRYGERPPGSFSKLSTFRDGILVLKTIFMIFKDYKPLLFFGLASSALFLISIAAGYVVVREFIETRFITHVPLAVFASGAMILAMIFFVTGIILDSANKRFDELYTYLTNREDR